MGGGGYGQMAQRANPNVSDPMQNRNNGGFPNAKPGFQGDGGFLEQGRMDWQNRPAVGKAPEGFGPQSSMYDPRLPNAKPGFQGGGGSFEQGRMGWHYQPAVGRTGMDWGLQQVPMPPGGGK